ncbi:Sphingosine N-acyltransferase-like protein FUM18 [Lachnellula cervina]|uniref:Sphingosine N-acyltransferase-like protein FUM18 n=1 Tax=Lachnellula cervina TaxID=1316786 RepID=A0A7D8YZG3_9HELO|nr:Sphingosine N-acyltransferase-like protein FUM18 [Lachnellula cervina]
MQVDSSQNWRPSTQSRKGPKKGDSLRKYMARWLFDNQIGISSGLIATLFVTHICMARARPYTSRFFNLSYYNSYTGKYAAGHNDFFFISFCIVLFAGIRAAFMKYVLVPLATVSGTTTRKNVTKFSEQGWIFTYYTIFCPLGMYIYYKSPYFLNMEELWTSWPQRELNGLTKAYILAEGAYYVKEIVVLHIQGRRKDYWEMMGHHVVTVGLIYVSYAYHQTRVGHLILMLMDFIDLVLPLAKCLKYLGFTTLCDIMFGVFVVSWLFTRHVFYLLTCWSVYSDIPRLITPACYKGTADQLEGPLPLPNGWSHLLEPFRDLAGTVCFNNNMMFGFLCFLLFIQILQIMWSISIFRIVVRVLQGNNAEDVRSDMEDEEEEQQEKILDYNEAKPLEEEEFGGENIVLTERDRRTSIKGTTTGVSFPGQNRRKQFLNRMRM